MPSNTTPETRKAAKAAKLAEQLKLFESLPPYALVALPVVCAITGRSPASVWRDVKAGRCPAPVKAGPRSTRWRVGDLRAA
ncbi:transcriptional regulator [Candidatus Accumulibacter phosphatis]|uniref:Transcriptional regulator n=1 Tax=Candidatus Accumulibacter contiguus TaxID=2954381 RepID=A0ABX1TH42_9PROT|nr:transcriptional regulator [Candidatus Accumulibacter contiguus]